MTKALAWRDLTIGDRLGGGQAGEVYRAELRRAYQDLKAGTSVAVKRYRRWVLDQAGQLERIFRELEVGRAVKHPSLVRTISAVADDEGLPALVMEFIEGETLETILSRHRERHEHPESEWAIRVIGSVAGALSTLHYHGALHRDVKPANIVVGKDRTVLMDLGVVRSPEFPEQTTADNFLGTIRYAAPEYLFGAPYDERIDVYSIGALTYELFFGRQFLGTDRNWATLVVKKTAEVTWPSNELYGIAERSTYNLAYLVESILRQSLCPDYSRGLDLATLAYGIEKSCWRGHYHFEGGRLKLSQPSFPLREYSHDVRELTATKYADRLRRILRPDQIADLRDFIAQYCWDEDLRPGDHIAPALRSAGVVHYSESALAGDGYLWFDPGALYTFRVGLLGDKRRVKSRRRAT